MENGSDELVNSKVRHVKVLEEKSKIVKYSLNSVFMDIIYMGIRKIDFKTFCTHLSKINVEKIY